MSKETSYFRISLINKDFITLHCFNIYPNIGKDCTFEKMEQVREQQERLARLHFELNAQQEIYGYICIFVCSLI